jgi:hypothetical protein
MATATVPLGHINTFRIGADPEFGLIDKEGYWANPIYCSPAYRDASGYTYNPIGSDAGGIAEIRPEPSYTVQGLLINIKKLLDDPEMNKFYAAYKWRAGAVVTAKRSRQDQDNGLERAQPVGGHIHLELPFKGYHGIPDSVFQRRLDACDAMTRVLERLDILPQAESERRRAGAYGHFGVAYSSGGTIFARMEYRTPCSWLFSPNAAFITLTGIKLAAVMPDLTINKFSHLETELQRWEALVEYFRHFRTVDSDAFYVYHRILKGRRLDNLKRLKANPDNDIKVAWAKFKTGETKCVSTQ